MFCHFFYELGFFSLPTSLALGVACACPFMAFSYIFRRICCTGLLGDLSDACDQEDVSNVMAAADAEAKFHVANAGGPLATCCAIYFFFVKPLIGERSEDYGKWLMIEMAIITALWVVMHAFYAWGTVVLQGICSKLLSIIIKNHVASIASILRDSSLSPKEKLDLLNSNQVTMQQLCASANARLSAPCMISVIGMGLGGLAAGLEVFLGARSGTSAVSLVPACVLAALLSGASFLYLYSMASVHGAYNNALAPLKHSLDLINLAEEVFPGNGLSYLACLKSDMALGFEIFNEPINSKLVVSAISSFAGAVLVTIVLGQVM